LCPLPTAPFGSPPVEALDLSYFPYTQVHQTVLSYFKLNRSG
jgi:hypothetical protein